MMGSCIVLLFEGNLRLISHYNHIYTLAETLTKLSIEMSHMYSWNSSPSVILIVIS